MNKTKLLIPVAAIGLLFGVQALINTEIKGDRQIACFLGPMFPAALLRTPPYLLAQSTDPIDREVIAKLNDQNADQESNFGSLLRQPMRFLGVRNGRREYLLGQTGNSLVSVDASSLLFASIGKCTGTGTLSDVPALTWSIHNEAPDLTKTTKTLRILVQDMECGGGRATLAPRLLTSIVVKATTIEIAIGARPLERPQPTNPDGTPELGPDGETVRVFSTCEGFPPNDVTIVLPVPLGDRTLIDVSRTPPALPPLFNPQLFRQN